MQSTLTQYLLSFHKNLASSKVYNLCCIGSQRGSGTDSGGILAQKSGAVCPRGNLGGKKFILGR